MLCGEAGSVDIGDFLDQEIKGPATFTENRNLMQSTSVFSEPAMNDLISSIFGDKIIFLECIDG